MRQQTLVQTFKKLLSLLVVATLTFFSVSPVQAQGDFIPITNMGIPENLSNYEEAKSGVTLAYYIIFIWRGLIFVGALMVIIYFVIASFDWISAQGEASKIAAARNKMTGAVAGFIVLAGLFIIIELISSIFGLNILQPVLPTAADPGITIPAGSSL